MEIVTVKSGLKGSQVALWERDPRHPDGEVYLAGAGTAEVALTGRVQRYLKDGRLVRVDTYDEEPAGEEAPPAGDQEDAGEQATSGEGEKFSLEDVNGIGPATAAALRAAGIETLAQLAAADAAGLAETLKKKPEQIVEWQAEARELNGPAD